MRNAPPPPDRMAEAVGLYLQLYPTYDREGAELGVRQAVANAGITEAIRVMKARVRRREERREARELARREIGNA